jgi:hypothetical protein
MMGAKSLAKARAIEQARYRAVRAIRDVLQDVKASVGARVYLDEDLESEIIDQAQDRELWPNRDLERQAAKEEAFFDSIAQALRILHSRKGHWWDTWEPWIEAAVNEVIFEEPQPELPLEAEAVDSTARVLADAILEIWKLARKAYGADWDGEERSLKFTELLFDDDEPGRFIHGTKS